MFCSKSRNDLRDRIDIAAIVHQALRNNLCFCCFQLLITFSVRINTPSRHARLALRFPCLAKASKNADSMLAIGNHAKAVYRL